MAGRVKELVCVPVRDILLRSSSGAHIVASAGKAAVSFSGIAPQSIRTPTALAHRDRTTVLGSKVRYPCVMLSGKGGGACRVARTHQHHR